MKKRAEELDARHPGKSCSTTFAQELASYGKYIVLISEPFAERPDNRRIELFICRGWALSTLLTVGVMLSHLVPRRLLRTTSIFFLVISPLISRAPGTTTAPLFFLF